MQSLSKYFDDGESLDMRDRAGRLCCKVLNLLGFMLSLDFHYWSEVPVEGARWADVYCRNCGRRGTISAFEGDRMPQNEYYKMSAVKEWNSR